jgi:hypothetical protein
VDSLEPKEVRRVGYGVRGPPASVDVSPETEEHPLLEDVTKQCSETVTENASDL